MSLRGHAMRAITTVLAGLAVMSMAVILVTQKGLAASLGLSPGEIVVGPGQGYATATIFNRSDEPVLLRLSLIDMAMTPYGTLKGVAANPGSTPGDVFAGDVFAADKLRVVPRQLQIPAGETQSIRILTRPGTLSLNGMFHTHLNIKVLPSLVEFSEHISAGAAGDGTPRGERQMNTSVMAVFNLAFPVWLERGPPSHATADMTDLEPVIAPNGAPAVSVMLHRRGGGRLKGNLALYYRPADGNADMLVGVRKKVAVYPERGSITVVTPVMPDLLKDAGLDASELAKGDGAFRIEFTQTFPETSSNDAISIMTP